MSDGERPSRRRGRPTRFAVYPAVSLSRENSAKKRLLYDRLVINAVCVHGRRLPANHPVTRIPSGVPHTGSQLFSGCRSTPFRSRTAEPTGDRNCRMLAETYRNNCGRRGVYGGRRPSSSRVTSSRQTEFPRRGQESSVGSVYISSVPAFLTAARGDAIHHPIESLRLVSTTRGRRLLGLSPTRTRSRRRRCLPHRPVCLRARRRGSHVVTSVSATNYDILG